MSQAKDSKSEESKEDQSRFFLVGSRGEQSLAVSECTAATCIVGYSMSLQRSIVLAITCKRWGCAFCGPCKVRKLAAVAQEAKPNSLVTLTVNPKLYENPRQAFEATRRVVAVLARKIRTTVEEFEYLRVLEVTKKGWPHYHLIARTAYIPQRDLSGWWAELTGAPIVDIRRIKKREDAYWYVVKYLSKQKYIPWTNRRVTMTKHFKRKEEKKEYDPLDLTDIKRWNMTPEQFLYWECDGQVMERISPLIIGWSTREELEKSEASQVEETEQTV